MSSVSVSSVSVSVSVSPADFPSSLPTASSSSSSPSPSPSSGDFSALLQWATHSASPDVSPSDLSSEIRKVFSRHVVVHCEMPPDVQSEAMDIVVTQMDKQPQRERERALSSHEQTARNIKELMDKKFGPSWHCAIGEGFSFQITAQEKTKLFVYIGGHTAVLLFKC